MTFPSQEIREKISKNIYREISKEYPQYLPTANNHDDIKITVLPPKPYMGRGSKERLNWLIRVEYKHHKVKTIRIKVDTEKETFYYNIFRLREYVEFFENLKSQQEKEFRIKEKAELSIPSYLPVGANVAAQADGTYRVDFSRRFVSLSKTQMLKCLEDIREFNNCKFYL